MKIKKGDTVLVISGKDRLKTGKVLNVFPKKEKIIETVNREEEYKKWATQIEKAGDYWLEEERKLMNK
jgi:large subunit ribosomal protein L24